MGWRKAESKRGRQGGTEGGWEREAEGGVKRPSKDLEKAESCFGEE